MTSWMRLGRIRLAWNRLSRHCPLCRWTRLPQPRVGYGVVARPRAAGHAPIYNFRERSGLAEAFMGSAKIQGELWGAKAADWAEVQEPGWREVYGLSLIHIS